jgi:uncharacterized membrane protein
VICFNKDFDPSENKNLKKLIKLLKSYDEAESEMDQIDEDLSNLLDIVYDQLFTKNKQKLSLTIFKGSNNNINIQINGCR